MNARLMREPEDMGGNEHEESSDCKAIGCTPVEQPESSEGGIHALFEEAEEVTKSLNTQLAAQSSSLVTTPPSEKGTCDMPNQRHKGSHVKLGTCIEWQPEAPKGEL